MTLIKSETWYITPVIMLEPSGVTYGKTLVSIGFLNYILDLFEF